MNIHVVHRTVLLVLCASLALGAPQGQRGRAGRDSNYATQNSTCNDVPAHPVDVILGRPTQNAITISVLTYQDTEGFLVYGTQEGQLNRQTPKRQFKRGEPGEVVIGSLQPDTQYFYEFRGRGIDKAQGTFHTQRPRGSSFTFTITADSHLDDRVSAELYLRTLANAVADKPDFHVDLGDTFMTEKHDNRENAARQYIAQRYYFGQLCRSAPLFLVLGNHDGESPRGRGSEADALAVWSNLMRKRYFPNPFPDGFYTGNAAKHPQAGLLQDYYAWQWGDALFVVLDPYWFTQKQRGMSDNWKHTLGREQYLWLGRTLEASKAKFKFVFIHHLVGGLNDQCRGGAEAALLFEWGGRNLDGSNGFRQNRAGWPAPIHQLLARHHVSAVFHGHDHLYVKQDLEGIVYQEVPQPGTPGNNATRTAAEYGYKTGVILSSAGHLRVRVSPAEVTVQYVRAYLREDERSDRRNVVVAPSYTIPANPSPVR
jgi:predicted phosphodiesterase